MDNKITKNGWESTRIKELTPGIQNKYEKANFKNLDFHKSQLKNEELWYRVQQR